MIIQLVISLGYFLLSFGAVYLPISGKVPSRTLPFLRHFGTGIIIATAFMHLLAPSAEALNTDFPWANFLCLVGVGIELSSELVTRRLRKDDDQVASPLLEDREDPKSNNLPRDITALVALESGIVVHSIVIGLTLALDFHPGLGVAIAFHQLFEGLGIGARLLSLDNRMGFIFAILFAVSTPLGMILGLALSAALLNHSNMLRAVSGVWDALASGLLIYTGLVELLAGEFFGESNLVSASTAEIVISFSALITGLMLMSLLAIWA